MCHKRQYRKAQAKKVLTQIRARGRAGEDVNRVLGYFHCKECGWWHVGHTARNWPLTPT